MISKILSISLVAISISGCIPTERIRYASIPLPVPSRIELPTIEPSEIELVDDAEIRTDRARLISVLESGQVAIIPKHIYKKFQQRDATLKKQVRLNEAVIKSTHDKADESDH